MTPQIDQRNNDSLNLRNLKPSDWNDYATTLEEKIIGVHVPLCVNWRNVHCRDRNHIAEIDEYATNILGIVDNSIKGITKVVPGWNDEIKPSREQAMFWQAI